MLETPPVLKVFPVLFHFDEIIIQHFTFKKTKRWRNVFYKFSISAEKGHRLSFINENVFNRSKIVGKGFKWFWIKNNCSTYTTLQAWFVNTTITISCKSCVFLIVSVACRNLTHGTKNHKLLWEDTHIILLIFYWHIHSFYNSNSSKLLSSVMTVGFWEAWNNFTRLQNDVTLGKINKYINQCEKWRAQH